MDTRKDEQERTITIKSTGVSLYFEMDHADLEGEALETAKNFAKKAADKASGKVEAKIIEVVADEDAKVPSHFTGNRRVLSRQRAHVALLV